MGASPTSILLSYDLHVIAIIKRLNNLKILFQVCQTTNIKARLNCKDRLFVDNRLGRNDMHVCSF